VGLFDALSDMFSGDLDLGSLTENLVEGGMSFLAGDPTGGSLFDMSGSLFSGVNDLPLGGLIGGFVPGGGGSAAPASAKTRDTFAAYKARLSPHQLLAYNLAPQIQYQQIQQRALYSPVNQAPNNRDCLSVLDFVDQGFPSDQIPLSTRTRCRSWLTAAPTISGYRPISRPTFQIRPPATMTVLPPWYR
jgi:hypothetical protein